MAGLPNVLGGAAQSLTGILSSKKRVQFIQNNQTVVQLDASLSETHTSVVNPTEFPLENGSVISDFLITRPVELDITGIISDNPIGGFTNLLTEGVTSLAASLIPPAGLTALSGAASLLGLTPASKSLAAYLALIKLQKSGNPIDVITTLTRYSNMFITSISIPRDAANGKILLFTVKIRQLLIVQSQSVNLSSLASSALAAANADVGNQSPSAFATGYANSPAAVSSVSPGGLSGGTGG